MTTQVVPKLSIGLKSDGPNIAEDSIPKLKKSLSMNFNSSLRNISILSPRGQEAVVQKDKPQIKSVSGENSKDGSLAETQKEILSLKEELSNSRRMTKEHQTTSGRREMKRASTVRDTVRPTITSSVTSSGNKIEEEDESGSSSAESKTIASLKHELAKLKEELLDKDKKYKEKVEECDRIKESELKLTQENQRLKVEIENSKESVSEDDSSNSNDKKVKLLQRKLEIIQKRMAEMDSHRSKLLSEFQALQVEKFEVQKKLDKTIEEFNISKSKNERYERDISFYKEELKKTDEDLDRVSRQLREKQLELDDAINDQEDGDRKSEEVEALEIKNLELEEKCSILAQQLDRLCTHVEKTSGLYKQVESLTEENSKLNGEINRLNEDILLLEEDLRVKETEIQQISADNEDMQKYLIKLGYQAVIIDGRLEFQELPQSSVSVDDEEENLEGLSVDDLLNG
eukprot:TRINITY_DN7295_c0_g1_i1.p1 TRINITY_DN7295_c0_g1~~TRINITY_DN7295_c0_g1_i1.p1  ORF type:complete len:458 (-),score=147.14 TRINITY_DN7295_c0_g1_i1:190-1563(-)